jgi:hypothetical protein
MRTQVTGHGLTGARINYWTANMAYIETSPASNASVLIGYNSLIHFSDTRIDRANLDTGRIVTCLTYRWSILIRVFKCMNANSGAMRATDVVMRHGAGEFAQAAPCALGGIDEYMFIHCF